MDLFDYMRKNTIEQEAPLASRLRPSTLDEVVGQKHIIGKDKRAAKAELDLANARERSANAARRHMTATLNMNGAMNSQLSIRTKL